MPNEDLTSDPLMGTIQQGGFVSEEPPDVTEFLNNIGIAEKQYVCTIKKAPLEGSATKTFLPGNYKGCYPEIEDIGKRFGPGQYFYVFAWTNTDAAGKSKKSMKEYKIYLGSEWDDIHDDHMAELWAKKEKNIVKMAQQKKLRDAARGILPDDSKTPDKDPIDEMRKTMGVLKDLGVPIGGNQNLPQTNNDSSMTMMMAFMQLQQKSSENSMTMMVQMMGMMMSNNKPQSNGDMMSEMFSMFKGMVNMKEILNPEKQTMVDRLFTLAESAMPAIMAIAAKPREQRAADPLVGMVKNSEDFNNIKNDPEALKEMIRKWDDAHGYEKTNIILETVGLRRPGSPIPPDDEPLLRDPDPDIVGESSQETEGTAESADFEDVESNVDFNGNPTD